MKFLELCKSNRLTKKRMGEITGLSQPTIKLYCKEPRKFPIGSILDISEETEINTNELVETIKNEHNESNNY